jgi:predicted enzyme related to lactoylglutathione lyase
MITKIAFVSHPTRDMAASKKFFKDILGLKEAMSYEDKWCEFDTPDGKSIALDTFSPTGKGAYLALETDNIEKELARLRKRGVNVVMDLMDNKVCKMAMVQDPNGHSVMIHQMEPGRLKALNASKAKASAPAPAKTSTPKAGAKAKTATPKVAASTSKPKAKAAPAKPKKAAIKAKPAAKARRAR